jgi:hypothetical protein
MLDGLSWNDLDPPERRVIAMLRDGVSIEFCDAVAFISLSRLGLIRNGRLTRKAESMIPASFLHEIAA